MSKKQKLLSLTKKDFRWDYYRGTGKGGQKRNKTSNCVRCTHEDSKAVGRGEEGRSQAHNKRLAFRRCVESKEFKKWLRIELARRTGAIVDAEAEVERLMQRHNLRFDGWNKDKGKWEPIDPFAKPEDLPEYVKGAE